MKKIIALLLSMIMVFCALPMTAFAENLDNISTEENTETTNEDDEQWYLIDEQESATGEIIGNVAEVISLREENVKHFRLSDGTYEAVIYSQPVHRKDKEGIWQDIDNTIELKADKNISKYETQDSRISFANTFKANSDLFTLSENGYSISMQLLSNGNEFDNEMGTTDFGSFSTPIVNNMSEKRTSTTFNSIEEAIDIDNRSSIVYNNIKENTNIEYVLRGNDVKENIIITAPCESYEYIFKITLDGLFAELGANGEISVKDNETNEIKYIIPAPYMYDANGNYSYDVSYTLEQVKDEIYLLAVTADSEWINAEDRAFPVVVDPTIQDCIIYYDSYVDASNPNDNYGLADDLWVSDTKTTYMKIDISDLPAGATFNSAHLYVPYYYHISTGYLSAAAYRVLSSWGEQTINYSNAPALGNIIATDMLVATSSITESNPGTAIFNLTSAVEEWYNGTTANYGIAIKRRASSLATNQSVILKSFDAHEEQSYLSVNYTCFIPDGVYAIQNVAESTKWMSIPKYSDTDDLLGNPLECLYSQQNPLSSTTLNRSYLFKITRIPNSSQYIIRSMLDNNITFNLIGDQLKAQNINSDDDDVSYYDTVTIEWGIDGFTISPYGSSKVISMSSASSDEICAVSKADMSDYALWNFKQYTGVEKKGFSLISTSEQFVAGDITKFRVVVWTTVPNCNTPDLFVEYPNDDYINIIEWDSYSYTAIVEFLVPHQITIKCSIYGNATNYTLQGTYQILPIGEGIYYIQNAQTQQYITEYSDSPDEEDSVIQFEYEDSDFQQWEIEYTSSSYTYVTIRSMLNDMYLGVDSEDPTKIVQYNNKNTYVYWKISITTKGNYKITPYTFESSNQVLKSGLGEDLTLDTYVNNDYSFGLDYDEWYLVKKVISIVNYYDASLENDSTLRSYIPQAVAFANLVYSRYLHIGICMNENETTRHSIFDNCNCNQENLFAPCNTSYENDCINAHHKNTVAISNNLYYSPRENNHIYVLWTNRLGAYCKTNYDSINNIYKHVIQTRLALVYGHRPVIHFLRIIEPNPDIFMSLTLVHEMAHTFNMDEPYEDDEHDVLNATQCVMESFEQSSADIFYQDILNGVKKPFCDSCNKDMKDYTANIIILGN